MSDHLDVDPELTEEDCLAEALAIFADVDAEVETDAPDFQSIRARIERAHALICRADELAEVGHGS